MGLETLTFKSGNMVRYNTDSVIGEGNFGIVFSGQYLSKDGVVINDNVAIKIPIIDEMDVDQIDLEMEIKIGLALETVYEAEEKGIVMPYLGRKLSNKLKLGASIYEKEQKVVSESRDVPLASPPSTPNLQKDGMLGRIGISQTPRSSTDSFIDSPTGTFANLGNASSPTGSFVDHGSASSPTGSFVNHGSASSPTGSFVNHGSASSPTGSFVDHGSASSPTGSFVDHGIASSPTGSFVNHGEAGFSFPKHVEKHRIKREFHQDSRAHQVLKPCTEEFKIDIRELIEAFIKMTKEVRRVHEKGILHLDIKGENFLYDANGKITLVDYGLSCFTKDAPSMERKLGSMYWMPPEVFIKDKKGSYTEKQDVYSLGRCLLLSLFRQIQALNPEAIFLGLPVNPDSILDDFETKTIILNALNCSPNLNNITFENVNDNPELSALNQLIVLVRQILKLNPDERPDTSHILNTLQNIQMMYSSRMDISPTSSAHEAHPLINSKKAVTNELCGEEEEKIKSILFNVEFGKVPISNRFLAESAINDYNRRELRKWDKADAASRGSKPIELSVPIKEELDRIIKEVKSKQMNGSSVTKSYLKPD